MAAYFLIQGIALLIEPRHWDRRLQRIYMYVVVIGPAPLSRKRCFPKRLSFVDVTFYQPCTTYLV